MAKRNLVTCVYQSDDGKSMLRRLDSRYQSQMNGADPAAPILGGVAANATQRRTLSFGPSGLKPRSVLVATADGAFTGRLPVFTLAAYSAIAVAKEPNEFAAYIAAETARWKAVIEKAAIKID